MSNCIRPRVLEDYPEDLVLLSEPRICDKCGQPTMWAAPRQKKNGRHWSCIPGAVFWQSTGDHHVRAIHAIMAAFPGSRVDVVVEEGPMDVGYAGEGVGPCALCRGPIKRYGDGGRPLCKRCDLERKHGG